MSKSSLTDYVGSLAQNKVQQLNIALMVALDIGVDLDLKLSRFLECVQQGQHDAIKGSVMTSKQIMTQLLK